MITPDLHITITLTEEVVRTVCATIGFVALCWAAAKIFMLLRKNDV